MSKEWYPIIDGEKCTACGACIRKCTHGVYDRLSNVPVVVFPDGCVQGCRGCQSRCKGKAISYFGEELIETSDCGCGVVPVVDGKKETVLIEYLYLDDQVCSRCASSKTVLADALESLRTPLQEAGFELIREDVHIDSLAKAERHRLRSSPTIRVNGIDLTQEIHESDCPDCGSLCGTEMTCREWVIDGNHQTVPTKALLMRLILQTLFSKPTPSLRETDVISDSIRRFFDHPSE